MMKILRDHRFGGLEKYWDGKLREAGAALYLYI